MSMSNIYIFNPHPFIQELDGMNDQQIRLVGGEMTAQEMRTAKAILGWARSKADAYLEEEVLAVGCVDDILVDIAKDIGVHQDIWLPQNVGIRTARQLIPILSICLNEQLPILKKSETPHSQELIEGFERFLEDYLYFCTFYPTARVEVCPPSSETSPRPGESLHWFSNVPRGTTEENDFSQYGGN